MKGASARPLVVVENVEPDGNTTLGKFKQVFKMKLDEDWYLPGDVIHPGTSDKSFRLGFKPNVLNMVMDIFMRLEVCVMIHRWFMPV
jgi:hypothetical protein